MGPQTTPLTAGLANLSRKRFISYQRGQWRINPLNSHVTQVQVQFKAHSGLIKKSEEINYWNKKLQLLIILK